jgi:hypothetical protein
MAMAARAPATERVENRGWARQPEASPRQGVRTWGSPGADARGGAFPDVGATPTGGTGATTRVIRAGTGRSAPRGKIRGGLAARMLAIGLGGLLLVAAAVWLVLSGLAFMVVGAVLVIMVAYLAAASSMSSHLFQFGPSRGSRWERRPAEEFWQPGVREQWTVERADLLRQVAALEQRNAILGEQLRRVEGQRWRRPIDGQQFLPAAQESLTDALQHR